MSDNASPSFGEQNDGRSGYPPGILPPAAPLWPGFLTGQQDAPVRVLLVDDDEFMRRVIAQELLSDLRIQLEGQAGSLRDGRRLIATHAFDVLMVDLRLGDGTGFDLIREASKLNSAAEIIVITALEDEAHVLQAFELGATGYLLKDAWLQSFAQAVLQVVNGGAAITPRLARRLLARLSHRPAGAPPAVEAPQREATLTARECEVLRFVARGHVTEEIGTKLGISGQTVNAHIKNIYKKLHVHSRAQAVSYAAYSGLI
ncbi:response regulator transcription factor [Variovorax sp. J22G73]|jgi:DNA-binding NarL/FixJ family response regulator|uniref:LuxR C-terminal-related transcriptional regulator n=1 Tax=unclassified Variovorax TaxID=663243 RepID=UPI000D5EA73B|nr:MULTISPECIES: response regulator transcription factor [unclassified Variovorax]MDM0006666.1 response regulator transcription factor [Variovorax sp. J22R203]MDM0097310.1 response regulator transcription factor [Variovorax sp. J22G73]